MSTTPPTPHQLRGLIDILAAARDFALTIELDDQTLEHDVNQICSYARRSGRARLLGLGPVLTSNLDPAVDRALDLDLGRIRALARALDSQVAGAPATNQLGMFDRDRTLALAQELAEVAGVAHARTAALLPPVDNTTADDRFADPVARPYRPARWLAAVTSSLLPTSHQARYAEEFAAELWDLAEAGGGWWRQNTYACQLLTRAIRLRRELNTYRHRAIP